MVKDGLLVFEGLPHPPHGLDRCFSSLSVVKFTNQGDGPSLAFFLVHPSGCINATLEFLSPRSCLDHRHQRHHVFISSLPPPIPVRHLGPIRRGKCVHVDRWITPWHTQRSTHTMHVNASSLVEKKLHGGDPLQIFDTSIATPRRLRCRICMRTRASTRGMRSTRSIAVACATMLVLFLVATLSRRGGGERVAKKEVQVDEQTMASLPFAGTARTFQMEDASADVDDRNVGRDQGVEDTRLLVKEADIGIQTHNASTTADAIAQETERIQGLVVASNHHMGRGGRGIVPENDVDGIEEESIEMTIRVPNEWFQNMVKFVKSLAITISHVEIQGRDVTDQAMETDARLKNLEATRDKLLALLQDAKSVSDTLSVQRELGRVTEQLEVHKARLAYLKGSSSKSTLRISIQTKSKGKLAGKATQSRAMRTFTSAIYILQEVAFALLDAIIYVAVISVPLLLIMIAAYVVYTKYARSLLYTRVPPAG